MTAKKPAIWLLDDSGLSRESWWIQLGIPSTLNFPDYFALTRKNRTEREEEQRKIMLNEMVKTIHSYREHKFLGGVLKCMLINGGQTKSNGDTVYLRCGSSKYHLLSPLPWAEYKAKRQIRQ